MASLQERLHDALLPDYEVERELAHGGMGVVFLARDAKLDRPVAIKVLLPDLTTSRAAAQFQREAQILARLSPHPHIVPVYDVGEKDGLFYYVMAYIKGETLADRIDAKDRLDRGDVLRFGRDILDALETVHAAGVLHRDIKPANILLLRGHAMVGDFGIAQPPADHGVDTPGGGTPRYMAPEQHQGEMATVRSDIYAVGLVLYEALTRRRWSDASSPDDKLLVRAPWIMMRVLKRALSLDPERRWPDARTFRRRWWATRLVAPRVLAGVFATGVATVAVAITLWIVAVPAPPLPGSRLTLRVIPFETSTDPDRPWLSDSLSIRLRDGLQLVSQFVVLPPDAPPDAPAAVELRGVVTSDSTGVSLHVSSQTPFWLQKPVDVRFTAMDWETVADSATNHTIRDLWSEQSPLASFLPREALPATPRGFDAWLRAERLLNGGHWGDAHVAFHAAVSIDSTCVLCSWRIVEIDRWLFTRPVDSLHRRRAIEGKDLFPSHFRRLIQARLELADRLDTLILATEEAPEYYYSWWLRGEEELNRGPIFGLLRAKAAESLEKAAVLRPVFAPIWWDLAWIYIAEGRAADAERAMQNMPLPRDQFSQSVTMLLQIAFAYRFGGEQSANQILRGVIGDPVLSREPNLPSVPRLMPSFGAIEGMIQGGGLLADSSNRPDLRRSGVIAQLFGRFAMGQMDAAREHALVYQRDFPGDEFPLFFAQLEAVNAVFDSSGAASDMDRVESQLQRYASRDQGAPRDRRSAQWVLQLMENRNPISLDDGRPGGIFEAAPAGDPLGDLLEADRQALAGNIDGALTIAGTLRRWEVADLVPDPFFRTVLHLLLADWYSEAGNLQAAVAALRWHEALDMFEFPNGRPLVQEIDWTFGTLARWKRAGLLDRLSDTSGETCSSYRAVAELWADGDGVYTLRSAEASAKLEDLGCGVRG